jgi:hypothetical protein
MSMAEAQNKTRIGVSTCGKATGAKNRYVMLSDELDDLLCCYRKIDRPSR